MVSIDILNRFPIFSGLNPKVLQKIAQVCSVHTYNTKEYIFKEGERAQCFYMLLNGKVSIERELSQTWLHAEGITHAVIHTERVGEVFGWSSLVEPGIFTASALCNEPSEVIEIEGKTLLDILDKSSNDTGYVFMQKLASIIALRLIETAERLTKQTAEVEHLRVM